MQSFILIDDISNHLPVFSILSNIKVPSVEQNSVHKRKITEKTVNNLINSLREINWDDLHNFTDVNRCYEYFLNVFMKLLNENCPMQCVRIKSRINKPWFTNGLKNACRKKNNLYKSWLANKTECAQQKYKKYRNKLSLILRKAEKTYYQNK